MTGAYLRVKRDKKFLSIEVEYLTDKEREEIFTGLSNEEMIRWLNVLCNTLQETKELSDG